MAEKKKNFKIKYPRGIGRRIQVKGGPEIKPFKIKQEPLSKNIRPKGLGAALRGGGRAFNKGGKV